MNIKDIEKRLGEIEKELSENEEANVEELAKEVEELKEKRQKIKQVFAETRKEQEQIEKNANEVEKPQGKEQRTMNNKEIRNAFEKYLKNIELTNEERAVLTVGTGSTIAMPKVVQDEIWDLVHGQHALLDDVNVIRSNTEIAITKHTANAGGKAKKVAEDGQAEANNETFVTVLLSGDKFIKNVEISFKSSEMTNLLDYIEKEVAIDLAEAVNNSIYTQIKTDCASNNTDVKTAKTLTWADVTTALAKVKNNKRGGELVAYCNNATYYGDVVGAVDSQGKPLFDKIDILKLNFKVDESVEDHKILFGYPKCYTLNIAKDVQIIKYDDNKTMNKGVTGAMLAQGSAISDKAFAILNVKQA